MECEVLDGVVVRGVCIESVVLNGKRGVLFSKEQTEVFLETSNPGPVIDKIVEVCGGE